MSELRPRSPLDRQATGRGNTKQGKKTLVKWNSGEDGSCPANASESNFSSLLLFLMGQLSIGLAAGVSGNQIWPKPSFTALF